MSLPNKKDSFLFSFHATEGKLEVVKGGKVLGTMEVGRAFGELALLYDCPRTASVKGQRVT